MSTPGNILIFGRDPRLLETRQMLLRSIGGNVYIAQDRTETERLIRQDTPDLLVLCFTLSDVDREQILIYARTIKPDMKVLVLLGDGSRTSPGPEEVVSIFSGPVALKAKVEAMLGLECKI